MTAYLPGLEDLQAPPPPQDWAEALDRLDFKPGRKVVMKALRSLAGTRPECSASNEAIKARIVKLGHTPPSDRGLTDLLRKLEVEDRLIERAANPRAKSRRRIHFVFLSPDGPRTDSLHPEDRLHPSLKTAFTHGCGSSSPMPEDRLQDLPPVLVAAQEVAPTPVSPLNSIPMQEGETLTEVAPREASDPVSMAPADPEPVPVELGDYWARAQRHAAASRARAAAAPPPAPTTVELISRLADPCGPEAVEAAARQIAAKLGDERSEAFYRGKCEAVRAGELPAKTLADGFRAAISAKESGLARPGGVLVKHLEKHGPPGSAHKPAPGPTRQSAPGAGSVRHPRPISNCIREVIS